MGDSILTYNGGAVIAMKGKDCVAIASDTRYGIRQQTLASNFPKVHKLHDKLFIGLSGLATDQQTFLEKIKFRINLYKLREEREIRPKVFSNLVSTLLYERRFGPYFIEPVVAGLEPDGTPYISAMDLIGAPLLAEDFVIAGTCSENLYGMCESLYKPDLDPEDLFEVISQSLLAAVDRDAMSGWGGIVHILTKDKIISRTLKGRQD